ncbi:peptide chain release factor 1 [Roseibium polysiphoniae]|uniref:Peptide chain release factor 1 n=1 Tax=Roseibium polysiphoniae TaxID=2571221 RepID=A0A944CDM5_9HYPH|nr:hypothetical protein [Roseibium polysiphoniae]MBS8260642.1 peptide chain release factor 1 [Roseibium polysiphoniae]
MQDVYAETVSAINFNNGVVRMLLVDQDPQLLAKGEQVAADIEPRLKQQVIMPLPGFLYMLSVVKGLMEDPKMQGIIEKYAELGLLPSGFEAAPTGAGKDDEAAA